MLIFAKLKLPLLKNFHSKDTENIFHKFGHYYGEFNQLCKKILTNIPHY